MNKKIRKILAWIIFIAYIAALVYFVFFAESFGRTDSVSGYRYNLVPLKEIKRYIYHIHQLGIWAVVVNLAGNIVAFIPYGYCLPMVTEHRMKFFSVLLYTFNLSLMIELVQLISKVGCFDVDDLLLNTLGGILGYIAFCFVKKVTQRYKRNKKK